MIFYKKNIYYRNVNDKRITKKYFCELLSNMFYFKIRKKFNLYLHKLLIN